LKAATLPLLSPDTAHFVANIEQKLAPILGAKFFSTSLQLLASATILARRLLTSGATESHAC
jgi:hypothetical protein